MRKESKKIAWAKLPWGGIGNKLLVWAAAQIFATNNHISCVVTTHWSQFSPGTWLRWEKSKRLYFRSFKKNSVREYVALLCGLRQSCVFMDEKDMIKQLEKEAAIYCFNTTPHWSDYFFGIRENRAIICSKLDAALHRSVLKALKNYATPYMALHVRLGDFRPLEDGENFAHVGLVRTPIQYFIDTIHILKPYIGPAQLITIFSDGSDDDLADLLNIEHVVRAAPAKDMVHILAMSKSKLIVLSAGSTFGQWAAFLSNAVIIHHPDHFPSYIRDKETNRHVYEGICPFDPSEWDAHLTSSLERLRNGRIR